MADPESTTARIILRAQAKALGLKRYYPGTPCKRGHIAERATVNGLCLECSRIKQLASYYADREENLRQQKIRRDTNPNHAAQQLARAHARDPGRAERSRLTRADHAARAVAQANGLSMYQSERLCPKDGTGQRFTGDGKCVECNRINCLARWAADPVKAEARAERAAKALERAEQRKQKEASTKVWRAARSARQEAMAAGALTYQGKPCPQGHDGVRYTKAGSCVTCLAMFSASPEKKAYDLAYYEQNKARIIKRERAYAKKNRERKIADSKRWAAANPEKRKAVAQNYKHRRRMQEGPGVSSGELARWKKAQPKVCYWCACKCPKGYHVDHYVPLSKGGAHELSNLVIACGPCNRTKQAKDPYEFAASIGRLF